MRQVWMTRPEWSEPEWMRLEPASPAGRSEDADRRDDSRLRSMPLQRLEALDSDTSVLHGLSGAVSPWIVWTSPAAVQAFFFWLKRHAQDITFLGKVWLAAIGSGTRDQLLRLYPGADKIVCADSSERADAPGLLTAMDLFMRQKSMDWASQTLLVVEGESNRPTLREGFVARGAVCLVAELYRRVEAPWPESAWTEITRSAAGALGLVVTSSGAGRQLIAAFQAHGLALSQVIWCTHHAAIAQLVQEAGVARVRRVRLNHQWLSYDLFEHEAYW
ncbi:MAG: uroporphyrinogen-III synthase [Betaproteobacteria bacterium]|nr:uroporphyrinogen-III synthase [Betaproteobacteria bacterium]